MELLRSPLHDRHRALNAKLTQFGGWDMPLSFELGTLEEHRACRAEAVVFDVSHLGTLRVKGENAFSALQLALSNDLGRIGPGRAQYTHLLNDGDGSVLDDIIVWWVEDECFDVMPNASNTSRVAEALNASVRTEDVTTTRALLAVQGPTARHVLSKVLPDAATLSRFQVASLIWKDANCLVAGTGYTGEDGVEIAVPAGKAADLWEEIIAAGAVPAGLGARDTLRLEAGLPLYGQELGPGITPLQANLSWAVGWTKTEFRGRAALEAELDRGLERRLFGIMTRGRRPPRSSQRVFIAEEVVGKVTSGNFSPTLECGIAMAFLRPETQIGESVQIEGRRSMTEGIVVDLPFLK